MSKKKKSSNELPVLSNTKARHKFILEDKYEAGIVLCGTEVKSIRAGAAQITESYARFVKDELFLFNVVKFKTFSESNILTFQDLVKNKIIL